MGTSTTLTERGPRAASSHRDTDDCDASMNGSIHCTDQCARCAGALPRGLCHIDDDLQMDAVTHGQSGADWRICCISNSIEQARQSHIQKSMEVEGFPFR